MVQCHVSISLRIDKSGWGKVYLVCGLHVCMEATKITTCLYPYLSYLVIRAMALFAISPDVKSPS